MNPERRRSLIVPREHGAWGILLVPLASGAALGLLSGGRALPLAALTVAAVALFWLRTPVESWLGTTPMRARTPEEFRLVRKAAALLSLVALTALAFLFWGGNNSGLLWIGAASALAFAAQAALKKLWKSRMAAQIVGAAGLTAAAPAACYVASGGLTAEAWCLWGANLLFAANQIEFVQLRIRAARCQSAGEKLAAGRVFLASQLLMIALLTAACIAGWFRWPAALAFVPILYRGFAWFAAPNKQLAVRALGWRELGYAAAFGILLVAGLR